jgi:hypothetical protein
MKKILFDAFIIITLSVLMVLISYVLTIQFGDKCWLPRVGAVLVGISVLLEGWIIYDPRKKGSFDTMQPEKKLLKYVLFLALWGTLLWAFGDLQKDLFGIPVCK